MLKVGFINIGKKRDAIGSHKKRCEDERVRIA